MLCPAQWDALYLVNERVSQRCCLPPQNKQRKCIRRAQPQTERPSRSRSHHGIPQMKADFNEHCVSPPVSSCCVRAAEGTSHLRLLTQKNAVAGRSYQAFLCHSHRAPVVSCKNCSLFQGAGWLLRVESDGISGSGGGRRWEVRPPRDAAGRLRGSHGGANGAPVC